MDSSPRPRGSGIVPPMEPRPGSSAALFAKLAELKKNWIKGGWSWDSRYFGPVPATSILFVVEPVLTVP